MDPRSQHQRLDELWHQLDYTDKGYLNFATLKSGLKKIDHPLKDADGLLRHVLDAMDTNHDGHITFDEFKQFVKQTEQQLWRLFESIDRNHDGKMEKPELKEALLRAGLSIPNSKLDGFFEQVDSNHDGHITFDEWRNFLLFIPATAPNLTSVISYFSSTVTLNQDGDVDLSHETIHSIGTNFLRIFFGSIIDLARPRRSTESLDHTTAKQLDSECGEPSIQFDAQHLSPSPVMPNVVIPLESKSTTPLPEAQSRPSYRETEDLDTEPPAWPSISATLTLPKPGYFVAGALSGVVSRTSTAPLDRLRVYLIAQTGPAEAAVQAAKKGAPAIALKHAGSTLVRAVEDLWAAGGVRSLFAGNGLNVIKIMPESAIKFGSYEAIKRAFARYEGNKDPKDNSAASKFVTGGLAGMTAQGVVYPLDTLKLYASPEPEPQAIKRYEHTLTSCSRVQTETVKGGQFGRALIATTARNMWRESGPRAFYRGLGAGLAGMFPYAAIDLGTFELIKTHVTRRNAESLGCHEEDAAPGGFVTAAIGGFSGAVGASLVYPLNLLRTRLQTQGTAGHPRRYVGLWDVAVKTVQGEGLRGLFKGLTPNLLKVVPAMSISYVVYEQSKKAMGLP